MTTADLLKDHQEPTRMHEENAGRSGHAPLFDDNESGELRERWQRIQGSFVDEPRSAVQQADELVATAMQRLAAIFANERSQMENEWSRGDEVSTEDLRQALRRYRSFFDRLLTI